MRSAPPPGASAVGFSGENPTLGNIAKKVSQNTVNHDILVNDLTTDYTVSRALRFLLQAAAREVLLQHAERVHFCYRRPHGRGDISVQYAPDHGRSFVSGLQTCGSVWMCPVCAAKIAERRRLEVKQAIDLHTAAGGMVVMLTRTIRHHNGDNLGVMLGRFSSARKALKQGHYKDFTECIGLFGTIKSLEVTFGVNGAHPHDHELWFLPGGSDLTVVENYIRPRWERLVKRFGLPEINKHGVSLDYRPTGDEMLNLYMTKAGGVWDLDRELTGSATKKARGKAGRTPAAILYDWLLLQSPADRSLWLDYALSFKGQKFVTFSHGLKAHFGIDDKSDEEIAREERENAYVLARLSYASWRIVLAARRIPELLDIADSGDEDSVMRFLSDLGCDVRSDAFGVVA